MIRTVCQVNTQDGAGGAAGVCRTLHKEYILRDLASYTVYGRRKEPDPASFLLDNDRYRSGWGRFWMSAAKKIAQFSGRIRGAQRLGEQILPYVAAPRRAFDRLRGYEDFNFPASGSILNMLPERPDVVHLHNVHGNYFDLASLTHLSRSVPTVLTLHDLWTMTGHCAHPFDCAKWMSGCGQCPDLKSPPDVRIDATHRNWKKKKSIFSASRLYVAAPSQWALDKVERSLLCTAAARTRLIPNGIDTTMFSPGAKSEARARVGLPPAAKIIMFAANGIRDNPFRDFTLMVNVAGRLSTVVHDEQLLFLAIGENAPTQKHWPGNIRCIPYINSPSQLKLYYRSADVYLHPALADVFPSVILEALACGTPVVSTRIGGIPEQISDGVTGVLTPVRDTEAMVRAVVSILADEHFSRSLSAAAAHNAALRYDKKRMADQYLSFYEEAVEDWAVNSRGQAV